jgi:hypothetical protein
MPLELSVSDATIWSGALGAWLIALAEAEAEAEAEA